MRSLQKLIAALKRLPGIGPKQAERLALYLLRSPDFETDTLIAALKDAKAQMKPCDSCCDFTEGAQCRICSDPSRDRTLLCVVEEPQDVAAIERSRSYKGLYHVLHGSLSPLDGIAPEHLRVKQLLARMPVAEVILATDPDTEGEATALYLSQLLKPLGVKASRIAHGVPLGGDLDYIDERTLAHALTGRKSYAF
jgi:recombination protein RecR